MTRRWNAFFRKVMPIASAGVLLQAGSCAVDPGAVTQGLLTAMVNQLIASFVAGLFNVPF